MTRDIDTNVMQQFSSQDRPNIYTVYGPV